MEIIDFLIRRRFRAAQERWRADRRGFLFEPLEQRLLLSLAAPASYQAVMASGLPDPTPVSGTPIVGNTYYVQPNGSDSNAGTGAGSTQAWATINHAVSVLQPGDTVYVAPGTYTGTVDIADAGDSGTPNASINYIADPTAAHFPGIAPGNVVVTGGTAGFLVGHDFILISGFDITGSTLTTGINVAMANPTAGYVMGTSILNNTIQNLGPSATAINLTGANNGDLTTNTEPESIINTTIQGNTIANISGEGIEAAGVWTFRVNANIIHDVSDRGIDVNTLVSNDNHDVFITNNLIYNVCNGITAADVITDPVTTWAGGYTAGPWTYGLVIENNTVVLDNVEAVGTTAGVPDPVRWGIRSSRKQWPNNLEYIANNIITSNQSNVSTYVFENHDLHPSASILHYYIVPDGELGYNDVYNPDGLIGFENQIANETVGAFSPVVPSEDFSTLVDWRNTWGWDYGSISTDPNFVNPAANNYQLAAGSVAVDGGDFTTSLFDVGYFDLNGNPRIVDGRIDMGAYESTYTAAVPLAPLAPSALTVTAETTTDGLDNLLSWTINSTNEDGFHVQQSLNGVNWQPMYTAIGEGVNNTYAPVLLPNTTYYYRVSAFNAGGSSGWSNVFSVTTPGPASAGPPPTPSNLSATVDPNGSQIDLYWLTNDEVASNMQISRSTDGTHFTPIATLIGSTNVYVDANVTPGVTYTYQLMASNDVGNSATSNSASASITPAPVSGAPGAPIGLDAAAASSIQINLAWTLVDDTDTSVQVYRSTDDVHYSAIATLSAGTVTYSDTGLLVGATYYYYVDAVNNYGATPSNTAFTTTLTGQAVYLSTLPFVGTPTNGWGPVMRNVTVGAGNGNPLDSNPLTIKGVVYPSGLGVHANSSVTFALNGQYSTFDSYIGLDDEVAGDPGAVYFQVWGDGAELYSSPLVVTSTPTISVNVSVAGVQQLTLIVTQGASTNAFDHSDWAEARLIPNGVTIPQAPGMPTGLAANAASSSQIDLDWTLADNTDTSVVVYRSTNDSTFSALTTLAAGANSYNDTGLAGSTTYYYYVDAVNGQGSSPNSNTASTETQAKPTVPGKPTGLTANAVSSSQINLSWTLADATDTSVVVYTSTNDSSFTSLTTLAAGATAYNNTGLAGSTTYYYYVDAVNGQGSSPNSSTANAKTQAAPTVPGKPTSLTANAVSSSQINLSWTLADATDTSVVVYTSTNDSTFTSLTTLAAGATAYNNTGLAGSTTYYYYVDAVNGQGSSLNSNTASTETQAKPTAPGMPTGLTAAAVSSSQINLSWTLADTTDTSVVVYSSTNDSTFTSVTTLAAGSNSYSNTGLPSATEFYYYVDAVNGQGSSSNSNTANATTQSTTTAQPVYLSTLPFVGTPTNGWGPVMRNVTVGAGNGNPLDSNPLTLKGVVYPSGLGVHAYSSVTFALNGQYSNFDSYVGLDDEVAGDPGAVYFQVWGDGAELYSSPLVITTTPTISVNVSVAGVQQLTLIVTQGASTNAFDHSDWAEARVIPTGVTTPSAPGMPVALTATTASSSQINLAWTLADTTDTSVVVYSSTNDSTFTPLATLAAGAISYNNTGLAGSTTYYYYVDAVNGQGSSPNSNTAHTATLASPTVPGKPTGLTVNAVSSSQINLSWTLADATDTSVVVYTSTNDSTFTSLTTLAAGANSYNDTGLAQATTYYFYIDAVNAQGSSPNSSTANAKTLASSTVPGMPTGLTATAVSSSQINLSWTLVDTTDTSVVLYSSTNDSTFTSLTTLAAGSNSYSNTGLPSATEFYYYVDAVNSQGSSANSNTANATTQTTTSSTQPVYLSTLPFVGTPVNGWGPVMRNVTVGAGNGNPADSNPLTLKGVVYPSGLGAHAYSSVTFALNGQYSTFDSYIGIDDEVDGAPGEVYFQVWGDGTELYASPLVTVSTPTISISVPVTGVQQLTLIVTQGGSTNAFDHSDWAEARLIPTGVTIPSVPGTPTKLTAAATSSSQINLGWTLADATDTSVVVYRSTNDTTFAPITTLAAGSTIYSDTGLNSSTTYYYEVSAVDAAGPSIGYATGSATTQAYVPPPTSGATYLSTLPFVGTPQNGWGPVMRNVTVGAGNGNPADSNPLTLKGVVYPEGLGVHAYSSVTFALNGQYSTFISEIGLDDEVATDSGSVYFQVWGDGVELYASPLVTAKTPTITVDVSVAGVQQLTLIVIQGGSTNAFDHSDWAGAELLT